MEEAVDNNESNDEKNEVESPCGKKIFQVIKICKMRIMIINLFSFKIYKQEFIFNSCFLFAF